MAIIPVLLVSLALLVAACAGAPEASPTDRPAAPDATTPPATPDATEAPDATETEAPERTDAASDEFEVVVGASSFAPGTLTVPAGTEVAFVNTSSFPHTVTHGSGGRAADDPAFDRSISEGGTTRITFDEPGTYEITCKIHPTMNMTVVVEG